MVRYPDGPSHELVPFQLYAARGSANTRKAPMPSTSPTNAQYAKVAVVMAANGAIEYECIHWYTPSDGLWSDDPQAAADNLAAAIDIAVGASCIACLVATCSYVGTRVILHKDGDYFSGSSDITADVGTVSGDFQPPQVAVVLAKTSTAPGRSGHGRFFMPLVPESFTTGYRLTPAGRTAYETLNEEWLADRDAGGSTWIASHFARLTGELFPLTGVHTQRVLKRQGRRELVPLFQ